MEHKTLNYVTSCLIFVGVVIALLSNFEMMLFDPDTAWHLAAGDLIRKTGALPKTDPWAFTSAGVPWINLAWLWDVWMSFLHEHLGWYGQVAFNSMLIGLTMAFIYCACLLRSGNGIASFFSILLVLLSIPNYVRSMWVSNLFLSVLFYLALLIQHRNWGKYWWLVMPALIPLWVNLHGGFIIAFFLLGAFGLQAMFEKNIRMFFYLVMVGILSIIMLGVNPYGYAGVLDILIKTFTTPALEYISEFKPSTFSWGFLLTFLYIPVFLFCAIHRKVKLPLAEVILAFGLILPAATSMRYWTYVYLFSAPVLAMYFTSYMRTSTHQGNERLMRAAGRMNLWLFTTHAKVTSVAVSLLFAIGVAFSFSPAAMRMVGMHKDYNPYAMFEPGIKFMRTHYPKERFLTDYASSGPITLLTQGTFPVFIDGRGETAYPRALMEAYGKMLGNEEGWDKMLEEYKIDGVATVTFYRENKLKAFFEQRKEWKQIFKDEALIIYVRE